MRTKTEEEKKAQAHIRHKAFKRPLNFDVAQRKKLDVKNLDQLDDLHHHWIKGGRVQYMRDMGYELVENRPDGVLVGDEGVYVTQDLGGAISVPAGDNTPERLYLMATPQEWYDKRQEKKGERLDQIDKLIEEGRNPNEPEGEKFKVKESKIKYNTKPRRGK